MYLHRLIEQHITNAKIYNKNGHLIDNILVQNEFYIIKNYLLRHHNIEDILAIQLEKNYQYVLTILACMSMGITYIPLSIDWPEERILQIQELSGCNVLKEGDINFSIKSIENQRVFNKNETLYIMFTSGTTGSPKGVKVKREGYENFLIWSKEYFSEVTSSDRMLLTTEFTFDISLVDISLFLTKNLSLYFSNFNSNIYKMLYELEHYKITIHSTVPYNYSMIMRESIYEKADLSSLKHIILGGARFPYNLYRSFQKYLPNCNVYNVYGPTEATVYCTVHKLTYNEEEELYKNNITIGKPFYNNQCIVVDNELFISGKQLMSEYLNNKEKTKEVLVEIDGIEYYKSGDIVFKNNKENYFVVGRKDDTIKISGYRVNLSDIDSYILTLEYINNAATIALDKLEGEHELVTYVILNSMNEIKTKKIRSDLQNIMPSYQISKYIKIVDTFPLNNSNKVCKNTLKKMFLENMK